MSSTNVAFDPPRPGKFIAYTPPMRMPGLDGQPITAASQTAVEYITGIGVKNIEDGGFNGGGRGDGHKFARVTFDHESLGLRFPIAASVLTADPAYGVLRSALANGELVDVAIEVARREKSETKNTISPLTPIQALRGASDPSSDGNANITKENCVKVIAAVNGVTTGDCRSDATLWRELSSNKDGRLVPEGYQYLADPDDWTKCGVALLTSKPAQASAVQAPAAPAPVLNTDELVKRVAAEVLAGIEPSDNGGRYIRRVKDNEIGEDRPWVLRTRKGQVNAGHQLVSKFRSVFLWARTLPEVDGDTEKALEIAHYVLETADRIQVEAYGGNVLADPTASSHAEIIRFLQDALERDHPPYTEEWQDGAEALATEHFNIAYDYVTAYAVRLDNPPTVTAQTQTPPAPEESPTGGTGVTDALLTRAQQGWKAPNAIEVLSNVGKLLRDRDELGTIVRFDDSNGVLLARDEVANFPGRTGAIGALLKWRIGVLSAATAKPAQPEPTPNNLTGLDAVIAGYNTAETKAAVDMYWPDAQPYLGSTVHLNRETLVISSDGDGEAVTLAEAFEVANTVFSEAQRIADEAPTYTANELAGALNSITAPRVKITADGRTGKFHAYLNALKQRAEH